MVVSESFARGHFKAGRADGARASFNWGIDGYQEIIGVVGDIKQYDLTDARAPTVFVSTCSPLAVGRQCRSHFH
jgi:hypothetical protein